MTHPFRIARYLVKWPGEQPFEHHSYSEALVDHNGRKVAWHWANASAREGGGLVYEVDSAGNERVARDYRPGHSPDSFR